MDEREAQIHRTWVQLIVDNNFKDIAAIAIDCELEISGYDVEDFGEFRRIDTAILIDIPTEIYSFVKNNERAKSIMERSLLAICNGRFEFYDYGKKVENPISFRVKLIEIDGDWKNLTRTLILGEGISNQGEITELMFAKKGKTPYVYNEIKFASQSEIRIAQEFESQGVLFFPLPLAVRAETGKFFEDHREVDFLICENGLWGILEVSYHPDRFEKDSEKDKWFKKSGILCVEHYSAEKCYNSSKEVVNEFLSVLRKHKK